MPVVGAAKKSVPVHKPVHAVKGQEQLAGGDGQFGTVYSMKGGLNDEILSARYSVDAFPENNDFIAPDPNGKILVLDIAIKNAEKSDYYVRPWSLTAVDQSGHTYDAVDTVLASDPPHSFSHTLKPGEGLGQPGLHNPLRMFYALPNDARIVKLISNEPRLNVHEDVFRYYIAGATAAEAGKAGDPKNVIAPLPDSVRDPSDPSGATALKTGKAGKPGSGVPVPAGPYLVTLDSFGDAPSDFTYDGSAADKGKKYVVAKMTMRNALVSDVEVWAFNGRGVLQLVDADGDTYDLLGLLKASHDEKVDTNHKVQAGDSYTVRAVWEVPSDLSATKLIYSATGGRPWEFELGQ
jgi:nucleoid-associated protein YgaU